MTQKKICPISMAASEVKECHIDCTLYSDGECLIQSVLAAMKPEDPDTYTHVI